MEVAVFNPISTGDSTMFGIIVLGAVVCLGVGIWGWKQKKQIAWMLGSFGVVILGGNAAFMKFSEQYVTPIVVYTDKIDTPNGLFSFDEIVASTIQNDDIMVKRRLMDSSPPGKVLILERKNGRGIMMAEEQYPIFKIKKTLDQQMKLYYEK